MLILHVTPEEYLELKACEGYDALYGTTTYADHCIAWYGCEPFEAYAVVVRHDVPAIPWVSAGVARFAQMPGGGEDGASLNIIP